MTGGSKPDKEISLCAVIPEAGLQNTKTVDPKLAPPKQGEIQDTLWGLYSCKNSFSTLMHCQDPFAAGWSPDPVDGTKRFAFR